MTNPKNSKQHLDKELSLMNKQVQQLEHELQIQKQIAFAAGVFQADVTVRTLLESLAEGVVICDQAGIIVLINRRMEELFGYKSEEVIGHSLNIYLPERFFAVHTMHINNFFHDPRMRSMGQGVDLTAKRKDGAEIPIEVSLSYLETEVGILGLAFVTDITERKQAEWALKLRNQELDAFARTVAHDLKGSLSVIIGYSETLADLHKTLSESDQEEYITALAKNGRQMSNIIDELLAFSSMRKEDVIHLSLDMGVIVRNTIQRLNHMIKEYNATIALPGEFHRAMGYGPWVEEIWYNYLSNAIKYGGSAPNIEIGNELDGDYVKYWVKDAGEGLAKVEQQKLFEPFTKLRSLKFEGHGLGLSIVKMIVEKLNGFVEVDSEVGQGSTFSFYLEKENF